MPLYRYKAVNEKGRGTTGEVYADNQVALDEMLQRRGLEVVNSKIVKVKNKENSNVKVSLSDLILLCIHLEQLEGAGVSILDSIADLRDSAESKKFHDMMVQVHESIKGGKMLSAAIAEHPKTFDQVFVSLIRTGEKTGNLEEVFGHLASHLKWVLEIRKKIKKALYYPIFLLFVMGAVVGLMMTYVVPKLSDFLLAQQFELPVYTKALIATSNYMVESWYVVILVPLGIILSIMLLRRISESFAFQFDRFTLKVPFIGKTVRKIELARFCRFFGIMYRSGIGIIECLDVTNDVIVNRLIKESAEDVKTNVQEGMALTDALVNSNQFPGLVIRMFKVGEESGQLDHTIKNVNYFYDREVEDEVNAMIGVIQPMLTIVMGGIMAWVSLAVFGPLYDSLAQMNF